MLPFDHIPSKTVCDHTKGSDEGQFTGVAGLLVRERRRDLRLSQADLAARAGVGREWLVAVEKGHPRAQLNKVLTLLAELGLTLDLSSVSFPAGSTTW